MIDPISSVVRLAPQRRPDPAFDQPAAPIETTPAPVAPSAPAAPETLAPSLALSVDRDRSGVFVYTLTDSASGRVIAVIPRSAVAAGAAAQGGLDIQA